MGEKREPEHSAPVAIVTGASRGIGREVAIGLAQDGYHLVLVARSADSRESVLQEIKNVSASADSLRHTWHAFDVTDFQHVEQVVASVKESYGRIDVLVNNAGIYSPGTLDTSIQEFERTLRANLLGPFAFMQAVIPTMKEQGAGYIINIASRAGKIGFADDGVYCASKFGLVGLNESLYRELASTGIKITAISPGWTNTEMAQKAGTPLEAAEMIQPSDILKTIRWLLSLAPATCVRDVLIECKGSIY